jgi:hypothetical protein
MELRRAGELGRRAMLSGLGLPEWSAIHHESVGQCLSLQPLTAEEIARTLTAAGTFFAESMAPFEANRREFRRSNTALRYQNSKLEDQVTRVSRVVFDEAMQLVAAAGLALDGTDGKLSAAERENTAAVNGSLLVRSAAANSRRPGIESRHSISFTALSNGGGNRHQGGRRGGPAAA